MRTTTIDPLAEKYYSISPYAWCGNNPVLMVDPDGRAFETAWDLYSLYTGAKSFVSNVKQGNVGAAILDGVGVIADAAAVVVPGVPGGVGAGIKAVRTADNLVDAAKTGKAAEKVVEGAKGVIYKVPGEKTPSGKPYVGSADDLNQRAKTAKDGRDRTGAEIIGEYPKGNTKARKKAEQVGMDKTAKEQGKKPNQRNTDFLDNKRNEISDKNRPKYGL